jgi:hypothetical protein
LNDAELTDSSDDGSDPKNAEHDAVKMSIITEVVKTAPRFFMTVLLKTNWREPMETRLGFQGLPGENRKFFVAQRTMQTQFSPKVKKTAVSVASKNQSF